MMEFVIPRRKRPPVLAFQHGHFTRLIVHGKDAVEFAASCGTCGLIFEQKGVVDRPISDVEAVELLGDLSSIPSAASLELLAQPLPSGRYSVGVFSGVADLALPGAASDFFVEHVVRLNGEGGAPQSAYLRHGEEQVIPKALRWGGGLESALATTLIYPLQDIGRPDEQRVQHWIDHHAAGGTLTALAVSIVDQQAPAMDPPDLSYPHREHRVLVHFLIDGHHRAVAAARLGAPLRLPSFASLDHSNADEAVIADTIERFLDHAASR